MPFEHEAYGDPDQPAILFLHGFLGTGRDWAPITDILQDEFYCLCPDLPGHGATPFSDAPDYAQLSAELLDLADAHDLDSFHVAGYSMGGRIALYLATQCAMRVNKIAMLSASPGIEDPAQREERLAWDAERAAALETSGLDEFLKAWYAMPLFASLHSKPELLAKIIKARRGAEPEGLAQALRVFGAGSQPPLWEELPEHRIPTLHLAGELDEKYRRIAQAMRGRCPAVQVQTVGGAGHVLHLEAPEASAALLSTFFSG